MNYLGIHQISVRCTARALYSNPFRTFRISSNKLRIRKRVRIYSAPHTAHAMRVLAAGMPAGGQHRRCDQQS